jgi:hypothetical protein
MADDIVQLLDTYHQTTLKQMAEAAGLTGGKRLSKAALHTLMQEKYFAQERITADLAQLDQRERDVLDRLLLHGGRVATRTFRREIVRAGLATEPPEPPEDRWGYARYRSGVSYAWDEYGGDPSRTDSDVFEDVMARLAARGIVFSETKRTSSGKMVYKLQFHPAEVVHVPQFVRVHLPEPQPIPLGNADWQPDHVQVGDPTLFLRDLYLYWDFVRHHDVPLLTSGLVGKRFLNTINDLLLTPDPTLAEARRETEAVWLYMLRQLASHLGLLQAKSGQCLAPAGSDALHIPAFWHQSLIEQVLAILRALTDIDVTLPEGKIDKYDPQYRQARRVFLRVLQQLSANAWIELDDIYEHMQNDNPNFLFVDHEAVEDTRNHWYSRHVGKGYYYGDPKDLLPEFVAGEQQFIRGSIDGFLRPLGLVELGYKTDDDAAPWHAFRLTPFGQEVVAALSRDTTGAAEPTSAAAPALASPHLVDAGSVIVQPNFQILAMGPVPLHVLAQLDLFADRERADRGAFEYRLSRTSVYAAQQLGLDVTAMQGFLTGVSSAELPQNVRRSLEEWAAHHERIIIRTGVALLQTANAEMLEKLMAGAATGNHLARALAPEVALIKGGQKGGLVTALLQQDVLPTISGATPDAADQSVFIDVTGGIRAIHAVPSLHLRGRLAHLAEETKPGVWKLTAKSVRRAGGNQKKVLTLLDELTKLHRGRLPDELIEQVKTWGHYYGTVASETLTLLEFHNQTILDELRQLPELGEHLTLFPDTDRALAIVANGKLAEVRKTLARFGINVKKEVAR